MAVEDQTAKPSSSSAEDEKEQKDRRLDLELEQTFPASDAIPWIHDMTADGASAAPKVEHRRAKLYLDDFSVGQRFMTDSIVVRADEIKSFAARFDPQPFHLDEVAAEQSVFGGLTASGWHTAAMSMRLLVDSDMQIAGGLVGVGGEVTWPRAVRPGDVLKVKVEVLDVTPSRSKPDRGIVKARNETLNQRGEPVQIAIMKLIVPRNPA